jgi:Transglutaminase-like superfamily
MHSAGGGADLSPQQPLVRDRSPIEYGVVPFRSGSEGLAAEAICDHVHDRITFGYAHASPTKTAFDAYTEKRGVCRDFAHLAVTLCRCMNIPARYCTGYLGDIGVPLDDSPMDFSAWSKLISAAAGTRSMHGTTSLGLAAS